MATSNNHSANNRSSIFETFHTPNFGDENFEVGEFSSIHATQTLKTYSRAHPPPPAEDDIQFAPSPPSAFDDDPPAETTLWMSCSPGRNSTDSEDDCLPLSQLAAPKAPVRKNAVKKASEPSKPQTAYGLFYRQTMSSIKTQNHNASAESIARTITSMWDSLEQRHKDVYEQRADKMKQDYDAYHGSLTSSKKKPAKSHSLKAGNPSRSKKAHIRPYHSSTTPQNVVPDDDSLSSETSSDNSANYNTATTRAPLSMCVRNNCNNMAVIDSRWDREYCSAECVVSHCRDVFTTWVTSRRTAKRD